MPTDKKKKPSSSFVRMDVSHIPLRVTHSKTIPPLDKYETRKKFNQIKLERDEYWEKKFNLDAPKYQPGYTLSDDSNANTELTRQAHAVKNNPNSAPEFVKRVKSKPKSKPKSRLRTSSEIAAGVKSTPSKMQIASLAKSGNTMLMGSKEVETPSTFNTSAASNIAKAPSFAKMAEDGASVKEMRSALKGYRKTVKGQVKEHKAAIKKQNKSTKFEKKISKIDNRANKAMR